MHRTTYVAGALLLLACAGGGGGTDASGSDGSAGRVNAGGTSGASGSAGAGGDSGGGGAAGNATSGAGGGSGSPGCECSAGPCCDGCQFLPAAHVCEELAVRSSECSTILASDTCSGEYLSIARVYYEKVCSGTSADCSTWGNKVLDSLFNCDSEKKGSVCQTVSATEAECGSCP